MKVCIQKQRVKIIQKAIYEYRCDVCGKKLDKNNLKMTYYEDGKEKHACIETCNPFSKVGKK